mgnify:CR=1 FL=1
MKEEQDVVITRMEAFEMALRLAIVAPDQESADRVVLMADQMAAAMTSEEVATVKEHLEFELGIPPRRIMNTRQMRVGKFGRNSCQG